MQFRKWLKFSPFLVLSLINAYSLTARAGGYSGGGGNGVLNDLLISDSTEAAKDPVTIPIPTPYEGEIQVEGSSDPVTAFRCTPRGNDGSVEKESCKAIADFSGTHSFAPGSYLLRYKNSERLQLVEVRGGQKSVITLGSIRIPHVNGMRVTASVFRDFTQPQEQWKMVRGLFGGLDKQEDVSPYGYSSNVSSTLKFCREIDPSFRERNEKRYPILRKMCEAYLSIDPETLRQFIYFDSAANVQTGGLTSETERLANTTGLTKTPGCKYPSSNVLGFFEGFWSHGDVIGYDSCWSWKSPKGSTLDLGRNFATAVYVASGTIENSTDAVDMSVPVFPGVYGVAISMTDSNGEQVYHDVRLGIQVH